MSETRGFSPERILKAKELLLRADELKQEARGLLDQEYKRKHAEELKQIGEEPCRCKHKRKDHSDSHSINYSGGACKVENCLCCNYLTQAVP